MRLPSILLPRKEVRFSFTLTISYLLSVDGEAEGEGTATAATGQQPATTTDVVDSAIESEDEVDARFTRADKDVYDECYKRMWWELGLFTNAFPSPKQEMDFMQKIWEYARNSVDKAGLSVDPKLLYKKKYKYVHTRVCFFGVVTCSVF